LVDRFDDNSNYRSGIQPWEKEGDTGFPRVVYTSTQNSLLGTDRWLENGSFARLKDISIGYQLPKPLISKIHLEQVRFYLSAQNLITITKYKGLDPEFNGGLYERGRDYGRFPNVRSAAIGLNVVF
ncbi:hypothetical protein LJC28_01590, partial [Dysgonomonas sp. OttesenSCG-928-D17]|nr:hypothetical protein [Dysgonomonas sp. OttesenSCG-928-D17]